MNISIVTKNEDFLRFLEERTNGMQIINAYSSLTDEKERKKFNDDFNQVDSFIFLDTQHIGKEFKRFLDFLTSDNSYFLKADEVLLVTHKDPALSPTPDLERDLQAITAYMEDLKINFRIARLDNFGFQEIYKSLTAGDNIRDAQPKKLLKYKVTHNSEGITIPPKKTKQSIVLDTSKGLGAANKLEDLQAANLLEDTLVPSTPIIEPMRQSKEFKDELALSIAEANVIFICGERFSGKTTLALKLAKELEEQSLFSAIIDLTGRKDIRLLNRDIQCDLSFVRGLSLTTYSGRPVIGMEVAEKIYTSNFLMTLLKGIVTNASIVFCEIDPDQLSTVYKSFRGNKAVLLTVPNKLTNVRNSIQLANSVDFPVVPVINNLNKFGDDVQASALKDTMLHVRVVLDMEDINTITGLLIR